ncbi:hypothetical protein ACUHMQ_15475 [Chitinimonas sp. PSY-7]|uniref:hypothetical protein n=1 Tax=Chitinimonas sp. PSY-7 TaxID=3459088 RepID=UPI00403FF24A
MGYRILKSAGDFPLHVVNGQGLPHAALTLYACGASARHSLLTAQAYTGSVLDFASWLADSPIARRQQWSLLGEPLTVRAMVTFFLRSEMKCVVSLHRDKLGFQTVHVEPTWSTHRRLGRLLAALRSFYALLQAENLYPGGNPMEGDFARELIAKARTEAHLQFRAKNGRYPMPADSGVDGLRWGRMSSAYFRLRDGGWHPVLLDNPVLVETVMTAGMRFGWRLRERTLVRVLLDTGCRIHEACGLTLADWAEGGFRTSLASASKGSHGRRVKRLFLAEGTVKLLQEYVDTERVSLDPEQHTFADIVRQPIQVLAKMPLFLTCQGTALAPAHFRRDYWSPAMKAAGLKLRLHQIRHWYVTMAIHACQSQASNDSELQMLRARLRQLMAWRSDMLPVYDQAIRGMSLPEMAAVIHRHLEQRQSEAQQVRAKQTRLTRAAVDSIQLLLDEMTGP